MIERKEDVPRDHDGGTAPFIAGGNCVRVTRIRGPLVLGGTLENVRRDVGIAPEVNVLVPADPVEMVVAAVQQELARLIPTSAVGIEYIVMSPVAIEVV